MLNFIRTFLWNICQLFSIILALFIFVCFVLAPAPPPFCIYTCACVCVCVLYCPLIPINLTLISFGCMSSTNNAVKRLIPPSTLRLSFSFSLSLVCTCEAFSFLSLSPFVSLNMLFAFYRGKHICGKERAQWELLTFSSYSTLFKSLPSFSYSIHSILTSFSLVSALFYLLFWTGVLFDWSASPLSRAIMRDTVK